MTININSDSDIEQGSHLSYQDSSPGKRFMLF